MTHLGRPTEEFAHTDADVVNIRLATARSLFREVSDDLLRRSPLANLLLEVGKRLHEEERRDVHKVMGVEPNSLIKLRLSSVDLSKINIGPTLTSAPSSYCSTTEN